jgi:hypothetical protein
VIELQIKFFLDGIAFQNLSVELEEKQLQLFGHENILNRRAPKFKFQ